MAADTANARLAITLVVALCRGSGDSMGCIIRAVASSWRWDSIYSAWSLPLLGDAACDVAADRKLATALAYAVATAGSLHSIDYYRSF